MGTFVTATSPMASATLLRLCALWLPPPRSWVLGPEQRVSASMKTLEVCSGLVPQLVTAVWTANRGSSSWGPNEVSGGLVVPSPGSCLGLCHTVSSSTAELESSAQPC